jgi:hypothetical protein
VSAVFGGVLLITVLCALKIVLRHRLATRHLTSLDVLVVAIGFVLLMIMRLPIGRASGWVGAGMFIALPVFFRLLGQFEDPED